METCFVDTNIWLYAFIESQDKSKSVSAKSTILNNSNIAVSSQVINEVCVNLIKKAKFDENTIQQLIESFYSKYQVIEIGRAELLKASEIRLRHQFSYWDSLIVASALMAGARVLYSEDMNTSLVVENKLKIVNPLSGDKPPNIGDPK